MSSKIFRITSEALCCFSLFLLFIGIYFNYDELMYFSAAFMLLGLVSVGFTYLMTIQNNLYVIYSLLKGKGERGIV